MLDLNLIFEGLSSPQHATHPNSFVAKAIPGHPTHRIGKDSKGFPTLLLKTKDRLLTGGLPSIRLEHLTVQHNIICNCITNKGKTFESIEKERLTILRCLETSLVPYFLRVCSSIVSILGPEPTSNEVSNIVGKIADLFQALTKPPKKSVQGLWAELFIINLAKDTSKAVEYWHSNPEDKFDFSLENQRIEVKSCKGSPRKHHFSLEQIRPIAKLEVIVASVFVQQMRGGLSLGELIDEIKENLAGSPEKGLHLENIVAKTLGSSLKRALEERYDRQTAQASLSFFNSIDIPSIPIPIDSKISNIKFMVDLSDIGEIKLGNLSQENSLFSLLST